MENHITSATAERQAAQNFYTAQQFTHLGPLHVRYIADPMLEIGDNLSIEQDTNSPNAQFRLTDGAGNRVYDIGFNVEHVRQ